MTLRPPLPALPNRLRSRRARPAPWTERTKAPSRPGGVAALCAEADRLLARALRPVSLPALQILLGLLFVWFGALKVIGRSPVGALVSGTLPWADPHLTVLVLGATEVALGLGLVTGVAVRLVLPVLAAHLTGTFLTFVMMPELMFRGHNPFLLTESGEFVTKNLVLIAATLALIAHTGSAAALSRGTETGAPGRDSAPQPDRRPGA